jgi:hypothetical protein
MCQVVAEIFYSNSNLIRTLSDSTSMTNTAKYLGYSMTNKRDWINAVSNETARNARSKEEWRLAIN